MSAPLRVSARVAIPRAELLIRASRSSGPGGQHVNTSATRVELLWNLRRTRALNDEQRARAAERLAGRVDGAGFLRITASEHRSQRRNREAAEARLAELVRRALAVPRRRIATAPSATARERRLETKRRHGEQKRRRRAVDEE